MWDRPGGGGVDPEDRKGGGVVASSGARVMTSICFGATLGTTLSTYILGKWTWFGSSSPMGTIFFRLKGNNHR